MPTREELEQALVIKRLRIICMSKKLAPQQFKVQPMLSGKLALMQNGRIVVVGDPATRVCYMV